MQTFKTLVAACLAWSILPASASAAAARMYANETVISFKANSGDETPAIAGHFFVAENRKNPNSRQIRLNYIRFPATSDNAGAPIVYLAGGPGGSGIGTAKWRRYPLFQALREYGDVIALDQRGTGRSEQAAPCESDLSIPLVERFDRKTYKTLYANAAKQCLAQWQQEGFDVYGYTTVQNAWDIDALRQHLQVEKVSLWGISYGSHLALAAMKLFPERIDKVVIASAEGLDQTVKLPAQTDAYFQRVQAVIDLQPLGASVPDLAELMRRVHLKLDEKPITLQVPNNQGGGSDILWQRYHMQQLSSMLIADPGQYLATLIGIYRGLDTGDASLLQQVLQHGMFKDEPLTFRLMPLAMDVASGITQERLQNVQQQSKTALLGDWLNFPMPMLNGFDLALDLGDEFRSTPQTDIPTLLFSGTLDGRTYLQEQRAAVRGLTNLAHVTVKYAGHNLYMSSPEVLVRIQAFLEGGKVDTDEIVLPLPELGIGAQ